MAKTQEEADRSNLGVPRRSETGDESAGAKLARAQIDLSAMAKISARMQTQMASLTLSSSRSFPNLAAPMQQYLSTVETLNKLARAQIDLSAMAKISARMQTQMASLTLSSSRSFPNLAAPMQQYLSTVETLNKLARAQIDLSAIAGVNLREAVALRVPNYSQAVDQILEDLGLDKGAVLDPELDLAVPDEEYEALAQWWPEMASRVDELASTAGTAFLSKRRIRNSLARLVSLLFFAVCTFSEPLAAAAGGWIGALLGGAPGAATGGSVGAWIGKLASSVLNDRGVTSESVYQHLQAPEPTDGEAN